MIFLVLMSAQSSELSWCIMSEIKRQNVRRCLFERPDREKRSRDLQRQDEILSEGDIKRFRDTWAYDPTTGPLATGPYEYVAMDPFSEIPSFYTKGYSSDKSEPARLMPDTTCYIGFRSNSAKRKLDLDNEDENIERNSENVENYNKNVINGNNSRFRSLSMPITEHLGAADKLCGRLSGSSGGLIRSSSVPDLPGLSPPVSLFTGGMSPPVKPRAQIQSLITDHLPNKKQRTHTKTVHST